MSAIPDLPGVLSRDDVIASGEHLASLQTATGMIPWFPGGHSDPWNHVESAMALDVAGFHAEAERAYGWLADIQRPDGSWHNYYVADGERILPTHPPVTISLATDRYVLRDGRWLCTYRRFEHLFEGDTPVTNPNLDDDT